MLEKYRQFVLKLELVPAWWFPVRFVLHWLTLPLKLLVIGSLGIYQIIYQTIKFKNRVVPNLVDDEVKKRILTNVLTKLPVAKNDTDELYVSRVPYYDKVDGKNQNIDHQALWQGVYTFIMTKIGRRRGQQEIALARHMKQGQVLRGYNFNKDENSSTVSGDMLVGLSLAMLDIKATGAHKVMTEGGTSDGLRDKFDEVVASIIENDYSFLEGSQPEDGPERIVWDEELKRVKVSRDIKIKSARGMWQPGLETVGAQALTLLAAIRVADKKCGALQPKREYPKLLNWYGYGLLSLFPTAFVQHKRGYFNDHNCLTAAYILVKLADGKMGRLFWSIPLLYTFLLSYKWRNPYFTGLVIDALPWTEKYLAYHKRQCINLLYEEAPIMFSRNNGIELPQIEGLPIKMNETNCGEFNWDHQPMWFTNKMGDADVIRTDNHHSGLGWIASAIMIEPEEVKKLVNFSGGKNT